MVAVVVDLQRGILAPRVTRHYYCPDIAMAGSSVSTRRSPRWERLHRQGRSDIDTYVYINDDDSKTSLLGKNDAERLGIVKINLRGVERR